MSKDYNNEDGRWVTINGRRVFIAEGQSLGDAMKKSGKFGNVKKVQGSRQKGVKEIDYLTQKGNVAKMNSYDYPKDEEKYHKYLKDKYGTDKEEKIKDKYGRTDYKKLRNDFYKEENNELAKKGLEKENRVSLSEKQIKEGNRLNEKSKSIAKEDIQTYLGGNKSNWDNDGDFIRDLADNYNLDLDDAKKMFNEAEEDEYKNKYGVKAQILETDDKGQTLYKLTGKDGKEKYYNHPEDSVRKMLKDNGYRTGKEWNELHKKLEEGKTKADRNIDAFDDDRDFDQKEYDRRWKGKEINYNTPGKIGNMDVKDYANQRKEYLGKVDKLYKNENYEGKYKKLSDKTKSGEMTKKQFYNARAKLVDAMQRKQNQISKDYNDEVVSNNIKRYNQESPVIKNAIKRMSESSRAKTQKARERLRNELSPKATERYGNSVKGRTQELRMFNAWKEYNQEHPNSKMTLELFKKKYKG